MKIKEKSVGYKLKFIVKASKYIIYSNKPIYMRVLFVLKI